MMKPIYFPFTSVSKTAVDSINACFGQAVVYQPSQHKVPETMQEWAQRGILDIRIPVSGDEDRLDAILKDYRAWIDLRQGSDISVFRTQTETVPFFDDTRPSHIVADIKGNRRPAQTAQEEEGKNPDALFKARTFLQMAQEYDLQHFDIQQDLDLLKEMERDLLNNLKGEDAPHNGEGVGKAVSAMEDPGVYMTGKRIEAWTHLLAHDEETSGVFITSSPAVFEYLIEMVPEAETILNIEGIPVSDNPLGASEEWQNRLMDRLARLANGCRSEDQDETGPLPDASGSERKISLTVVIVPGETPYEFFGRWAGIDSLEERRVTQGSDCKNTLIGLVNG